MGNKWIESTLKVIETLGATTFQRDSDAVLDTVTRHSNGIGLRDLYRRHRGLKKSAFDEILAALEAQDAIVREMVKTKGRSAIVVRRRER
jgi:hypothetical protein